MTSYTPDALGHVVGYLRHRKGLTQEELGRRAGYKEGPSAGVSISRLEAGQLERLSTDRFQKIAEALGLSAEQLAQAAEEITEHPERAAPDGSGRIKDRAAWVQRVIDSRTELVTKLGRDFDDANSRATNEFFLPLQQLAARIRGVEPRDLSELLREHIPDGDSAEAEAAYSLRITEFGVGQALAESATAEAASAAHTTAAVFSGFSEAMVRSIAPVGALLPQGVSATEGLVTAMRMGRQPNRASGGTGRTVLLASVASLAVAAAASVALSLQRSRKQQRELSARLDDAEDEIAKSQANADALRDLMPTATDVLEYIAVHATHALHRWEARIGADALQIDSFEDQQRYRDFVTIAACQLAVANIDFQAIMTSRGQDLEHLVAVARGTISQARDDVTSRV